MLCKEFQEQNFVFNLHNMSAAPKTEVHTNETVPPEYRKKKLVKKGANSSALKHKLWLAGHVLCLSCGVLSCLWLLLRLPNRFYIGSIIYRLGLIGGAMSFSSTFAHKFGLELTPPITSLIAHENFQYMILSIVWMVTFKSVFKLIPFVLISTLHLALFKDIKPVLEHSTILSSIIAYDELILIVYLLLRTLFFRNASGFQLVIFLQFYWLRILYNKETMNMFAFLIENLDGTVSKSKNEKVLHAWEKVKKFLDEKQSSGHKW